MLDVADRLFSTLGQDLMDTVFWTATRIAQKDHAMVSISALRALFKFLFQFFLAFMYICVHSVIILLEATTLRYGSSKSHLSVYSPSPYALPSPHKAFKVTPNLIHLNTEDLESLD